MKICLIGAFDFVGGDTGGQPVKSRELYYFLCDNLGKENVSYIETKNWKKEPLSLFKKLFYQKKRNDVFVMLPAHNGLKVFSKVLLNFKKKNNAKIFYDVIGGWLPEKLKDNEKLVKALKNFDGIFVETNTMKKALCEMNFSNVYVMPNFKKLNILNEDELVYQTEKPYKLCTFSRVMKEKGIEDALNAVLAVNKKFGETVFTLDIYGPIAEDYTEKFNELIENFEFAEYKGVAQPTESVDILKSYYALLFPTRFFTEGIPGTIIDAYAAGIPVISSRWKNFSDVVDDGITGIGFDFEDISSLEKVLGEIANNPNIIDAMKVCCIKKAKEFVPNEAIKIMIQLF